MPPRQQSPPGRIAGIDFGLVRIGIAMTDPQRTLASPWENYTRRGPQHDAKRFQQLAEDEGVTLWVVGLPVHLDGGESEQSTKARQFGQWLAETTGVPVEFFDERFTSNEAQQLLHEAKFTRRSRRKRIDMLAAQIMLSAYLESRGARGSAPDSDAPGSLDD
jgi:putative Holliday junction resolvase